MVVSAADVEAPRWHKRRQWGEFVVRQYRPNFEATLFIFADDVAEASLHVVHLSVVEFLHRTDSESARHSK
jgi:hypothetical protein